MSDALFMKRWEVDLIHPVVDRTRLKAETRGLFPKRVRLAVKLPGWRRSEVIEWLADPNAWAERHRSVSAA